MVASAALAAGATLVNDVSGLTFDPAMGPMIARAGVPMVLMHAQGLPDDMQDNPRYGDVLLDVYDGLAERLAKALALGIQPAQIAIDPGIGFGKTLEHNLRLLRQLSRIIELSRTELEVLFSLSRRAGRPVDAA